MKVLDVCEFYAEQGGGVRTYVHRKLEYAASHGIEQVIVAPGPEDRVEPRGGGRIVWVSAPPLPVDRRYHVFADERAVHDVIEREAPDVVEGSSPWSGGWFAGRYSGAVPRAMIFHQDPVAVYPHTLLDRFLGRGLIDRAFAPYWGYLRKLAELYDATVVSGHWLAERLTRRKVPRVSVVPFGIDKESFSPERSSAETRLGWLRKCYAPEDAHLLVAVSRHHPEKRLGTLIEAVARMNRDAILPRAVALVIFGDGPLRAWVEYKARRVPYVHVAGLTRDRDELAGALASADAFLHGSAAETYGLVVAEALCSGLPLIVPDAGGASELAGPEYAELYRAGNPDDCSAAITRMLERADEDVHRAAYTRGAGRVLSAREHFEQLFGFYRELSGRQPGARVG